MRLSSRLLPVNGGGSARSGGADPAWWRDHLDPLDLLFGGLRFLKQGLAPGACLLGRLGLDHLDFVHQLVIKVAFKDHLNDCHGGPPLAGVQGLRIIPRFGQSLNISN